MSLLVVVMVVEVVMLLEEIDDLMT